MYIVVKIGKYSLIVERDTQTGKKEFVEYLVRKNEKILVTYGTKAKYRIKCLQGDAHRLTIDCDEVVTCEDTTISVILGEGIDEQEVKVVL